MTHEPTDRAPLRVLAWPATRKRADNPYTFLVQQSTAQHGVVTHELTPKTLATTPADIIHVHWPDLALLRGPWFVQLTIGAAILISLRVRQTLGASLVWTVHNLMPHEVRSPRTANWYMRRFASMVHAVISPSEAGLALALERYPVLSTKPSTVVPIGSYRGEYPEAPSKEVARQQLGAPGEAKVILAFGQIRAYKNLPHLVDVFREAEGPDAVLMIAGSCNDEKELARIRDAAGDDERIRIHAQRIDDDQLPVFFGAADFFVAPFSNILNSSSVVLALDYGCTVIAPSMGGLPELQRSVGVDWVRLYDGDLTPDRLRDLTSLSGAPSHPDLDDFDWHELGSMTARFFRSIQLTTTHPR